MRGDDEDDQEPQVEPVEAAAAFGDERRAAVRADRSVAETGPEPTDDAEVGKGLPLRPGRHQARRGTVRTSCGGRERRDGHERRRTVADRVTPPC